jgi:two-component system chemotaxis sensor kinase CheA
VSDIELFEIRKAFELESDELLNEMESALLAHGTGSGDAEVINSFFRTVHTIKGSAGIVGYEPVEHFCHCIENILVRVREHGLPLTQSLGSLLLTSHDHIRNMISRSRSTNGQQPPELLASHEALLGRLADWTESSRCSETSAISCDLPEEVRSENDSEIISCLPGSFEDGAQPSPFVPEEGGMEPRLPPTDQDAYRPTAEQNQRVVRVDAVKLDELTNLVTELVTASSVLETNVRRLADTSTNEATDHVVDLVKQLQEKSMVFRMVPVKMLFRRFQRIVHDGGKKMGKDIRLLISGGETELDKAVAEHLYDPMLHLIRNAIDHGIEEERERVDKGKPVTGTIHLEAGHDSGNIIIRVSDDGQGINLQRISRKASELGLLKRDAALSNRDLLSCIFEPGLSTLDEATKLSGRGVGMDVVRKAVESLRGRIEIATEEGEGTTFTLRIPLSLSLIDGFMVGLGRDLFIIPLELVQETLDLPDISIPGVMTNGCLQVRELPLPCLDLANLLGNLRDVPTIRHIVVVTHQGVRVGLIVDHLLGEVKAPIKTLGPLYRDISCVSGASILGDGNIALFLDTERLISESDTGR